MGLVFPFIEALTGLFAGVSLLTVFRTYRTLKETKELHRTATHLNASVRIELPSGETRTLEMPVEEAERLVGK